MQSKWREKQDLPFVKYGNFLPSDLARKDRSNFLTDKIRTLVQYELYRAINLGKLIREDRMWENLLSSQPLCFNLFGELHFDLILATKYFKKLFPEKIESVTEILFEHSPGRESEKYTGDKSAFDVFVEYISPKAKKGFIGIEVKYAESLKEEGPKESANIFIKHKKRYLELTNSAIFNLDEIDKLKLPPLSQIWRDHLLAIATKMDYDEGFFVFCFPQENEECLNGVNQYKGCLASDDEESTFFYPRYLETFIDTLIQITYTDWARELKCRYLGELK